MNLALFIPVAILASVNASANCRDNTNVDAIEIKKTILDEAKKIGYHQLGAKIESETYYGENLADSEYARCMPMNGMKLIILRENDFCDDDANKIKNYVKLYNNSVNELLIERSDCRQKQLTRI